MNHVNICRSHRYGKKNHHAYKSNNPIICISFIHFFSLELLIQYSHYAMQLHCFFSLFLSLWVCAISPGYAFSFNFSFVFINLHAVLVVSWDAFHSLSPLQNRKTDGVCNTAIRVECIVCSRTIVFFIVWFDRCLYNMHHVAATYVLDSFIRTNVCNISESSHESL